MTQSNGYEVIVFEFGFTYAFFLLPVPVFLYFLLPPLRRKKTYMSVPFFKNFVESTGIYGKAGVSVSKKKIVNIFTLAFMWILLVTALASPRIVGEPELKLKNARSLMFAIDLSGSMATSDWEISGKRATRWDAVKDVMTGFIKRREGDRIGLILFGTQAYLQVPFTSDLNVVNKYLQESEVGMPGERTAIGNAIGLGVRLFEADSTDKKVMILLTDGVDSGSEINPIQAARAAATDSVVIYTIGIGNPSANIFDVDEPMMKQISKDTGGEYFLAMDQSQLEDVYKTLNELEPIEYEEETYKPATLLYYYPLSVVIILALLNQLTFGFISLLKKGND
jgi:Ca-activated chloride channel family protein